MDVASPIEPVRICQRFIPRMCIVPGKRLAFKEDPDRVLGCGSMTQADMEQCRNPQVVIEAKALTASLNDERFSHIKSVLQIALQRSDDVSLQIWPFLRAPEIFPRKRSAPFSRGALFVALAGHRGPPRTTPAGASTASAGPSAASATAVEAATTLTTLHGRTRRTHWR